MNPADILKVFLGLVSFLAAVSILIRVFAFAFDRQSKRLDAMMQGQSEDYRQRINQLEQKVDALSHDVDELRDTNRRLESELETEKRLRKEKDLLYDTALAEKKLVELKLNIYENVLDKLQVQIKGDGNEATVAVG